MSEAPKVYDDAPLFRQKVENLLLDVLRATDLVEAKEAASAALRLAHRLRSDDVLISRELADQIQAKYETNNEADGRVRSAELRLAKARRRTKADLRLAVLTRDGNRCRYCGVELTDKEAQIDHWEPDGHTVLANLVTACRACNIRKSNITPRQLLRRVGMRLLGGKPETPPVLKVMVSKSVSKSLALE